MWPLDGPDLPPDVGRVRALGALMVLGLLAIIARLWYLQIMRGDELLRASEENRSRQIRRTPPRGQILDCNGRVLATNRPRIVVSAIPDEILPNKPAVRLLAGLLGHTVEDLTESLEEGGTSRYDPVRLDVDVDMATATRVEERRLELPGVLVGPEPIRFYPEGPLFCHALGRVGIISADRLAKKRAQGWRHGDYCGVTGIERQYDDLLRGVDGGQWVEVDATGRMRRDMGSDDPVPGATLTLTLDSDLQRVAMHELGYWADRGKPGAVVAMDPETGGVLVLASTPSYDPNTFVPRISSGDWRRMQEDSRRPEINRAVGMAVAPGSTFKPITAAAGLDQQLIDGGSSVFCPGYLTLGRWTKRCHKASGHGGVALSEAIAQSCDVYFYRLGQRLGPDTMAQYARRFGLGERTGIDLPDVELSGTVPDPAWKTRRKLGRWVGGDTVDYAIGQAMLGATPLQMCSVASAIGNGGKRMRPQLVASVTGYRPDGTSYVGSRLEPKVAGQLGLSASTLELVTEGMKAAMRRGGTGAASALPGIEIAGKTGTAERRVHGDMVNDAWFVCFAPADHPRIAICVYVQEGGHGGEVAAPIARRILARFFGLKVDEVTSAPTID